MRFKYWNEFIGYNKLYYDLDVTIEMIGASLRQTGTTSIFTRFLKYLEKNNLKLEEIKWDYKKSIMS